MTKTTIEIHRENNTTASVGHENVPCYNDSPEVLEALFEWAQHPDNLNKKVYRHRLYSRDENIRPEPHQWNDNGPTYTHKCDYVTYIDIYWQ